MRRTLLALLCALSVAPWAGAQEIKFGLGAGGGTSTLTSGSTATSGCIAGGILRSISNLVECGSGITYSTGILGVGTASTTRGGLDLFGATHAFKQRLQISESQGADVTLTLPTTDGDDGDQLGTNGSGVLSWVPQIITKGGVLLTPAGAADVVIWRAPQTCTVTKVQGHMAGGTSGAVNARKNGTDALLSSNLAITAGSWTSTSTIQNASFAVDDSLEIRLISLVGSPSTVTIQVECTR